MSLDNLVYATREQLQYVNDLAGERNAQRILARMEQEKLLQSVRTEKKIYFLGNRGKTMIGSNQGELKHSWIQHTLMRNEMYIFFGMPDDWKNEAPLKMNGEELLICDAMFKFDGMEHFIEIDNKQSMQANNDKIKNYETLSNAMAHKFGYKPIIVWYTTSNIRRRKLDEACENAGLVYQVY